MVDDDGPWRWRVYRANGAVPGRCAESGKDAKAIAEGLQDEPGACGGHGLIVSRGQLRIRIAACLVHLLLRRVFRLAQVLSATAFNPNR